MITKRVTASLILALLCTVAARSQHVSEQIVDIKVGGDNNKSGTYVYNAPSDREIDGYQIVEHSKWGDASYAVVRSSESHLEINWSVRSHKVKALGVTVDTKTARLKLTININLKPLKLEAEPPDNSSSADSQNDESEILGETQASDSSADRMPSQELSVSPTTAPPRTFIEWFIKTVDGTHWGLVSMILAILLACLFAIWATLPAKIKIRMLHILFPKLKTRVEHDDTT